MNLYAISDLHLSFKSSPKEGNWEENQYKPMSKMDDKWYNHAKKIYDNWISIVKKEDIVLVPGDISWAMRLNESHWDFEYLSLLPGKIIAIPGNHDYWWQSLSKVKAVIPPNMELIQNDYVLLGDIGICGTRGWLCPNGVFFQETDTKIYKRELMRMENSLKKAKGAKDIIVMMHYMPTNEKHEYSGFIELFQKYQVSTVVYGHLHGKAFHYKLPRFRWGIQFCLVSADCLKFTPSLIRSWSELS